MGLTAAGLQALRLTGLKIQSFPKSFREGMANRSIALGDTGDSAPATWMESLRDPDRVHVIASIHADSVPALDRVQREALNGLGGSAFELIKEPIDGAAFNGDFVHFGYRDNISQPRFAGIHEPTDWPDKQPLAPLGTVLLGHPTPFEGVSWRVPEPCDLGRNGAFNAFRVLEQDVTAFERYLDDAADDALSHPAAEALLAPGAEALILPGGSRRAAMREVIAAKMCGRWRDGTSLDLSAGAPKPVRSDETPENEFDYLDDDAGMRATRAEQARLWRPRQEAFHRLAAAPPAPSSSCRTAECGRCQTPIPSEPWPRKGRVLCFTKTLTE